MCWCGRVSSRGGPLGLRDGLDSRIAATISIASSGASRSAGTIELEVGAMAALVEDADVFDVMEL